MPGSWPRRGAIRSRCSSCRAGCRPRSWPAGFGLPADGRCQARIEASFRRRVEQLPDRRRSGCCSLAAAEPTGEVALLVARAAALGLPIRRARAPAEADGLLELGAQVTFRHPLLRSAIYRAASTEERRAAHRALAAATDPERDPDRRAWHRAHAIAGPDEDVAHELERSAGRARARGGLAAAAAFLERSAALTPDPTRRAHRALEAAASQAAGRGLPGGAAAARERGGRAGGPVGSCQAEAPARRDRGSAGAPPTRCRCCSTRPGSSNRLTSPFARRVPGGHTGRKRRRQARPGDGGGRARSAARRRPRPGEPAPSTCWSTGWRFASPTVTPPARRALKTGIARALREEGEREDVSVRWPWFARRVAPDLFADDTWHYLATRSVQMAREAGALAVLPVALTHLAHVRCLEGDLDGASALLDEADDIAATTGTRPYRHRTAAAGRVPRGRGGGDGSHRGGELAAIARGGRGSCSTFAEHARAVLYNGLGRYDAALAPAQSAGDRDELMVSVWSLPELVEAATRCGQDDVAAAAVERLVGADPRGGHRAGARHRGAVGALLSEGEVAERLYREAIERLGRTPLGARAGARAPRSTANGCGASRRRIDARDQLRLARDVHLDGR